MVLLLICSGAVAQNVIKGVVLDAETKETLPGANVLIKGTSQGVSTDINGEFSLNTSVEKGILVVSYISFQTKEVAFNTQNKTLVRISLTPDAQSLTEVVVTGNALLD